MPRHYQLKRNNPYKISHDIYMQMVYLIRSYPDLVNRRTEILYGSTPPPDGLPRGNKTTNPTEKKALVLCTLDSQLEAIEQTIVELKGKYEKTYTGEEFDSYGAFLDYGIFCYYRSDPRKDMAPCTKTWKRYRAEFIYKVAKRLNYF